MVRRRAFTLIELLVVVGIIAVLLAILLPSLSRARENAKKSVCAANLKGQGVALAVYAAQNGDWLPMFNTSAPFMGWLTDQSNEFGDMMVNTSRQAAGGMNNSSRRRMMYCPSNRDQNEDRLWRFQNDSFHVMGYSYMNDRGPQKASLPVLAPTLRTNPPLQYQKKWVAAAYGSMTEVATDVIIAKTLPAAAPFNWTSDGFYADIRHTTNHLSSGQPEGQNTLCFDGHVEWRKYSSDPAASTRVKMTVSGNNFPYFWIMNP